MKNIQNFENFEQINESKKSWITFGQLVIALGVLAVYGYANVKLYRLANRILDVVNSTKSDPLQKEQLFIDSIKNDFTARIKNEKLFSESQKEWIIDSLKTIQFKVIDSGLLDERNARACFINLDYLKEKVKGRKLVALALDDFPNNSNFIILKRSYITTDPTYKRSVVHELSHYYHDLIKGAVMEVPKMSDYVDKRISDDLYMQKKIRSLFGITIDNIKDKKKSEIVKLLVRSICAELRQNEEYLTSEDELYARFKTLKHHMHQQGFIKDMKHPVTKDDVMLFIESTYDYLPSDNFVEHAAILVYIDLDKISQIKD
jgi:hypothetical protein